MLTHRSLRTGNLKDTDWEKLIEGAGTIGSSSMIIDDTSGISYFGDALKMPKI